MALNLLVTFRSGKKQVLFRADYARIQPQLESKAKRGVVLDVEILPDDAGECARILEQQGVREGV